MFDENRICGYIILVLVGYNKGDSYEAQIFEILRDKGVLKQGEKRAGAAGNKSDAVFVHNGKEYNLEIKKDETADFGQKYLRWEKNKFVWSVDDSATKLYTKCGILDFANKVESARGFHTNRIMKKKEDITEMDKYEDLKFFDMKFKIPQEDDLLAQFYNEKEVYYIQIGKHKKKTCGFYHLGSDPADLGTRGFDGYMLVRFRAKPIRSKPVHNYRLQAVLKYFPGLKPASPSEFDMEEKDSRKFPPITP